ncbi:hypothetical protein QYF36_009872 [Acer negundo]|nr:hypothetical protein QYF36_009872 [Acer negundo]
MVCSCLSISRIEYECRGFGDHRTFLPSRRQPCRSFNYPYQAIPFGEVSDTNGLLIQMEFLRGGKETTFSSGDEQPRFIPLALELQDLSKRDISVEVVSGCPYDATSGYPAEAVEGYHFDLVTGYLSGAVVGYPIELRDRILS